MEYIRRKPSAEGGVKFLERAISRLTIQRPDIDSTPSTESSDPSPKSSVNFKGPLGLILLHAPSEPFVDFIFVHGLGGGSRKTWAASTNPYHYWPKEWLPRDPDFKHVRIHAFGYKADWAEKRDAVFDISDFARSLLADIQDNPDIRRTQTSIVLIGHSMGGIVMKQAYILARQNKSFEELANRFHTMFFFATPHRGSDLAPILNNFLKITWGEADYVKDLGASSRLISSVNDTFQHYAHELQLRSFIEAKRSTIGFKKVWIVKEASSTLGYANERVDKLAADHRGVVKFTSPSEPNYKKVHNALSAIVDPIVSKESMKEAARHDLSRLRSLIGISENQDSPEDELINLEEKRVSGSCEWLTTENEFDAWKEAQEDAPPILWLTGHPGSGKSVLCSHVVTFIEGHNADCSYFFFKHGTPNKSSVSDLLRSIAFQMAVRNSEIRQRLLDIEAEGAAFDKQDERAIWRKLFIGSIFLVKPFPLHYWIIDAMDECRNIQPLFSMLGKIDEGLPLRIFLTSRETQVIEHGMVEVGKKFIQRKLVIADTTDDIKSFIATKIDRLPVKESRARHDLTETILTKAAGSFLWVRLVVHELENTFSEEAIPEVLNDIPADMNLFYERILSNIYDAGRGIKLAKTIFTWTVCALKPLTLQEVQSAIKLDVNETIHNLGRFIPSICGELVFVDGHSRVQMIHQTAKDYLLRENVHPYFSIDNNEGHLHLAIKCLELLSSDSLKTSRVQLKRFRGKTAASNDIALMDYACAFFSDHLHKSSLAAPETMDALYGFLTSNVLGWIEHLAKSGYTHYITRTASNIQAYLEHHAKYYVHLGRQLQTVQLWTTDLIRIDAKFQNHLRALPSSIHWLIPPMCPKESIIHQTYTSRNRGLTVKGSGATTWADCLHRIDYHNAQTTAISYGEQIFAVGLSTGMVVLYNAGSGRKLFELNHEERVMLVEFGNMDRLIASSGFRKVRVWDVSNGSELWVFETFQRALSLVFSGGNEYLIAATQGNYVNCWNLKGEGESETIPFKGAAEGTPSSMLQQPPTQVSFSPEQDLLAIAYRGRPILLFNLESETFFGNCQRFQGQRTYEPIVDMIFNPTTAMNLLVVSYHDGALAVFNPWSIELLHIIPAVYAFTLACSHNGRTLATGSARGIIQLFDFGGSNGAQLTLVGRINAGEEGIRSLAFSSDNLRFIDIHGSQCRVWEPTVLVRKDLADGTQSDLSDSTPHVPSTIDVLGIGTGADITAFTCHPSGDVVFCGKQDGSITVYTSKEGRQACILYGHAHGTAVSSIAFSQDTSILVSADAAGRILIRKLVFSGAEWSASERLANKIFGHSIKSLVINPGGTTILVSGWYTSQLWTVSGAKIGSIPRDIESFQQAIQHPLQLDMFIIFDQSIARIYRWADFEELTNIGALAFPPNMISNRNFASSTIFYGSKTFVQFLKMPDTHTTNSLLCWQLSDFQLNPDQHPTNSPMPGFETLGPDIEHLIAVVENVVFFLDKDLWVCSFDLKTFAGNAQFRRHFFIPPEWRDSSGEVLFQLTSKNEFVFVKKTELVVIGRGLDFSETITLSKLQQGPSSQPPTPLLLGF